MQGQSCLEMKHHYELLVISTIKNSDITTAHLRFFDAD